MSFRVYPLLLWMLLASLSVWAEVIPVKINWDSAPREFHLLNLKELRLPTFKGAVHSEENGLLPLLQIRNALPGNGTLEAELTDALYEPFEPGPGFPMGQLTGTPPLKMFVAAEKKRYSAAFSLLPFRLNAQTGRPERLTSANLRYQYRPVGSSRALPSYAAHSKLASGTWFKLGIRNSGMFKIDADYLTQQLKLDPSAISMNQAGVFGAKGGMVPDENALPRTDDLQEFACFRYDPNGNNRFDAGDYVLFYAEGPDNWRFDTLEQTYFHQKNLYADDTYVFFSPDMGSGKTMTVSAFGGQPNQYVSTYDDLYFQETESYNPLESGRQWFGEKLSTLEPTVDYAFSVAGFNAEAPLQASIRTAVVGRSTVSGYPVNVGVAMNGVLLHNHNLPTVGPDYTDTYASYTALLTSAVINGSEIGLKFSFSSANNNAEAWIDYAEVILRRNIRMYSDQLLFRNGSSAGSGRITGFTVKNVNAATRVADVTDPTQVFLVSGSLNGNDFIFNRPTNDLREFLAFNPSGSFPTPASAVRVENQDLHASGQPDMLIITHDDFVDAANALADFHRGEGLEVLVTSVQKIYHEFGAGRQDISAIRDFIRMFYVRAGSDTAAMPKYVLMFGDASYDYKSRIPGNTNYVPTYESYNTLNPISTYNTDDFFVCLDEMEGGELANGNQPEFLDAGIGRLVVTSLQEGYEMVNKIKSYRAGLSTGNNCNTIFSNGSWRNMVTFVGDDEDGNIHQSDADRIAENARSRHPEFNFDKIYLDAFNQLNTPAGNRYPGVNSAIVNRINAGTLIMNYVGHGGTSGWAHERIFNLPEITTLNNKEKLPLFVTATCEFSKFDDPEKKSAGEYLLSNPNGGAIALITTVRLVFSSQNYTLNSALFNYVFEPVNGHDPSLGELLTRAKNSIFPDANNRKFVLLGDPALKTNYPQYDVVTTSVNGMPVSMNPDTLKALREVAIAGEIHDEQGRLMNDFNGTIYPVVYDKISNVSTLAQDPQSRKMNFKLYRSILFRGKASVVNGKFRFSFIVPKDIDYQYGNGRVSYYASSQNADAHGFTESLIIGGSADSFLTDRFGPEVRMYMNDERFVNGGTTNENPMLVITLADSSGINTVGNGVGHDLSAILDNNDRAPILLNDYYESELDNFRRGQVRYPFSKLAEGKHTLKVKAWDIYNNSSDEVLEFVVASSAKIALKHVFNYPNPFTTSTHFMLEHNQACANLNIVIQIFSVSGKLVKSLQRQTYCEGYRINDIHWDGLDEFNDPIGKGVYIYKVSVSDELGNKASKFEKLVVLR